jgi:hypothetical protein
VPMSGVGQERPAGASALDRHPLTPSVAFPALRPNRSGVRNRKSGQSSAPACDYLVAGELQTFDLVARYLDARRIGGVARSESAAPADRYPDRRDCRNASR